MTPVMIYSSSYKYFSPARRDPNPQPLALQSEAPIAINSGRQIVAYFHFFFIIEKVELQSKFQVQPRLSPSFDIKEAITHRKTTRHKGEESKCNLAKSSEQSSHSQFDESLRMIMDDNEINQDRRAITDRRCFIKPLGIKLSIL